MTKMLMVIVPRDESNAVIEALIQAGYTATLMESRGGRLRESQTTLFVVVPDTDVDAAIESIRARRRALGHVDDELPTDGSDRVGGAFVCVWDIDASHRV